MTRPLTDVQRAELADAIRATEASTRGEIYCVVARRSDGYFYPAAFMLALGMLAISLIVAIWLDRSWFTVSLTSFVLAQLVALAAGLVVIWLLPDLRILLVPRRLRHLRAHDNAAKQFLAHNVHLTEERTGVLLFVSLDERYAEIVVDAGIDAKVGQEEWDGIVAGLIAHASADRLFAGLTEGISKAGELLALHFPGERDNPNELDDHVVEI